MNAHVSPTKVFPSYLRSASAATPPRSPPAGPKILRSLARPSSSKAALSCWSWRMSARPGRAPSRSAASAAPQFRRAPANGSQVCVSLAGFAGAAALSMACRVPEPGHAHGRPRNRPWTRPLGSHTSVVRTGVIGQVHR